MYLVIECIDNQPVDISTHLEREKALDFMIDCAANNGYLYTQKISDETLRETIEADGFYHDGDCTITLMER